MKKISKIYISSRKKKKERIENTNKRRATEDIYGRRPFLRMESE